MGIPATIVEPATAYTLVPLIAVNEYALVVPLVTRKLPTTAPLDSGIVAAAGVNTITGLPGPAMKLQSRLLDGSVIRYKALPAFTLNQLKSQAA